MNPVVDFLTEKRAGLFGSLQANSGQLSDVLGKAVVGAGAAAAVGATVGGVALAGRKLYEAATKGRDFRRMIEFNPDLASEHEKDPKSFNQLFSSLRGVNPQFSQDPIISGSYMRRMVGSPMAGGVLTDAVTFQNARDKTKTPLGDLVQRHAITGTKLK